MINISDNEAVIVGYNFIVKVGTNGEILMREKENMQALRLAYNGDKIFVLCNDDGEHYAVAFDTNLNEIWQKFLFKDEGSNEKFAATAYKEGFMTINAIGKKIAKIKLRSFDINGKLLETAAIDDYPENTWLRKTQILKDKSVLLGGQSIYTDISQKILNGKVTNMGLQGIDALLFRIDAKIPLSEQKFKPFPTEFEK